MIDDAKLAAWQAIANEISQSCGDDSALCDSVRTALPDAIEEIKRLRAAHAEMVKRNALLRDRTDLPMERTRAYEAFVGELEELRSDARELRRLRVKLGTMGLGGCHRDWLYVIRPSKPMGLS